MKLAAFLDGYDATTRLLETAPKPDEYRKQRQALKTLYAAVPPRREGVTWAEEAAASSKRLLDLADMLNSSLTTLDEAMRALGQSSANSPESREACRQAAATDAGPCGDCPRSDSPRVPLPIAVTGRDSRNNQCRLLRRGSPAGREKDGESGRGSCRAVVLALGVASFLPGAKPGGCAIGRSAGGNRYGTTEKSR